MDFSLGFLRQSNRVIGESLIDGSAWSPDLGKHPQSCSEIMIVSLSETEKSGPTRSPTAWLRGKADRLMAFGGLGIASLTLE